MEDQGRKPPGQRTHTVMQGKYHVSNDPGVELSTVLGSCIAACLYDPVSKIGGMNHFLLPEPSSNSARSIIHGAQAMELLLNGMLKEGAIKSRMQGKLFGGAKILRTGADIGSANAMFAQQFLAHESIPCVSKRLGGQTALRVRFLPASGEAFARAVSAPPVEPQLPAETEKKADVTLF